MNWVKKRRSESFQICLKQLLLVLSSAEAVLVHRQVTFVAAGASNTCFISSTLRCVGGDWIGETSKVPTDVDFGRAEIVPLSLGHSTGCLVSLGGTLSCWGHTFTSDSHYFDIVKHPDSSNVMKWAAVSVGGDHACAISDAGALYCWGNNSRGQADVPHEYHNWTAVSCGGHHSCGVSHFGTLLCWGGKFGRLFLPGSDGTKFRRVACGTYHCCALDLHGHASCWQMANNEGGMSGQTLVPSDVKRWKQISAGWQHTCGISTDGKMICWGSRMFDETSVPPLRKGLKWMYVSCGYTHSCAIDSGRSLHCWGDIYSARLGNDLIQRERWEFSGQHHAADVPKGPSNSTLDKADDKEKKTKVSNLPLSLSAVLLVNLPGRPVRCEAWLCN